MSEIRLARVDSQLIHGQIYTMYCGQLDISLVLVANDETEANHFKQSLMDMSVPAEVETRYFSIKETMIRCKDMASNEKILLVTETPEDLLTLIQAGILPESINIGAMEMKEGKTQYTKSVAADAEDIKALKQLHDTGIPMEIRFQPYEDAEDIGLLLGKE